ncbi:hypothetical protein QBC32DRAFT_367543 [Pseudoneurospora amorphoporcata]|uniref:Uncharacterized protein n=1 Tax=Pseudoneurospora amorphoporcata TaxID=241081 RepID=A0AAN6P179_9PEZI|nr:hypothetical protein QBC32DRAFT_367543 [Pseudoneurospora amorphoporcata]
MTMCHSHHSYLFSKVLERHPNLTNEELAKEFKTSISRDDVDAFKAFVADELIWSRFRCLALRQGRDLIAKFQARIDKFDEELADEKKRIESTGFYFIQHYMSHIKTLMAENKRLEEEHAVEKKKLESKHKAECQDYSRQIEKVWAENKRLTAENTEVKHLNKDLKEKRDVQVRKFEVLLAEAGLEKEVKRKGEKIKDLEDEVADLKQDNAELRKDNAKLKKGLAELVESKEVLRAPSTKAWLKLIPLMTR